MRLAVCPAEAGAAVRAGGERCGHTAGSGRVPHCAALGAHGGAATGASLHDTPLLAPGKVIITDKSEEQKRFEKYLSFF